ncbi:MAG: hypothetical protein GWN16_09590, partial [Calditrichae bacterium]|nr:hypothetical protein [Calditrichia bacterium]NIW79685.1 hypothetical protein [Calditrichia bacterium]
GFGLAYRKNPPPDYPKRYWIQGDYWLEESSAKPDAYFVFGHAVKDTVQLWAGGYSLVEKRIRFGRIHFSGNGEIYFEDLMQKPVEILNKEDKYVFRFIFHHQTGEIRLDVNGVPMRCELPISSHKITHLGYMVKNGKVCFKAMEFDGD